MTLRTDADSVKAIVELDDDETNLTPFMTAANAIVSEVCAPVLTYDTTRLTMIETWLAAHFYCILGPRTTSVSVGVSVSYENRVDLGFNLTRYGQQAMLLDTNGGLAKLNKKITKGGVNGSVIWMGTPLRDLALRSEDS